ncbi:MAG: PAS domain-containing sensor histidine kinase, partial [Bacteroidia bacterium]
PKLILEVLGDPVFVKDFESKLIYVNGAFCEMFGLQANDVIGKTLAEHVPENERESFLAIDNHVIQTGEENINEETLTVKGLPKRYISTRKSRFVDSNGNKFLVGIIHDISRRVNDENELLKQKNELAKLNSTKDKLFSIIAHDLRSPFSNIIGLTDFIKENLENLGHEELADLIEKVNTASGYSLTLLDNLLIWAKSQTGALNIENDKTNIISLLKSTINGVQLAANQKELKLELGINELPNNLNLVTDKNLLKTVIRNLLSNAIKFTPKGGTIKLHAYLKNNELNVSVIDTGVGMEPEKVKTIFNVAQVVSTRGTENEKGTGLGLQLCYEFIHKLKGKIWVQSELGKGSSFSVSLPITN